VNNTLNVFEQLTSKYPFITILSYGDSEFIGIIQNQDQFVTSLYNFGDIKNANERKTFLTLGESWYWESNRKIPINIFLGKEWEIFRPYLKVFNTKDTIIMHGPVISLAELAKTKSKRRSIILVKRVV
jgi:hypothetical protein